VDVQLTSAVKLNKAQREGFAASLKKRLGREVRLHCDTDASLLGGAIIRAGDLVIDGSLSGRLERLAGAVTH
jgi:F-type H+-transporting ATPase subunit delta